MGCATPVTAGVRNHPGMATAFFLGAMSPYSWLAAERIGTLLPDAEWRPLFAGGVFKAHGRVSWGLTDDRATKIADCEARARVRGLGSIRWPDPWPTNDLLIARAMMFAQRRDALKRFALTAMRMAFVEGLDLGESHGGPRGGRPNGTRGRRGRRGGERRRDQDGAVGG